MDRLRIYNIALSVFNIAPLSEDDMEDTEGHPEVQILDLHLATALRKAMRERNWTFLEEKLDLGEDGGPEGGYRHSYALPEGLFRLTRADGIYRVSGNKILTDGMPLAYGIMQTPPDTGVPEDFYDLVAFALAFYASPKLSPGDTKYQIAMNDYSSLLSTMVMNDVQCQMRETREVANGDYPYI